MKDKRFVVLILLVICMIFCGILNLRQKKETDIKFYTEKNEQITEEDKDNEPDSILKGKIIVIDPGHGLNNISDKERISPDSEEKKPAYVSGTAGKNQTEEQLNLSCGLLLRDKLEERGAVVHMTRSGHNAEMSNIGRAEFANNLGADVSVKLHADGNKDEQMHGISVLVPAEECLDDELFKSSERLGMSLLDGVVSETGADNRGLSYRKDMTGFNWSRVPVALIEMGFMTNPEEDALMETSEYQNKLMDGAVRGLEMYFENKSESQ